MLEMIRNVQTVIMVLVASAVSGSCGATESLDAAPTDALATDATSTDAASPDASPSDALATDAALPIGCDSIHAARIAIDEGRSGCSGSDADAVLPDPVTSLQAGAGLDVAFRSDCVGMNANACAAYHYDHPTRTTKPSTGTFTAIFPDTGTKCADGTHPVIYLDRGFDGAGDGDPGTPAIDGTNKWAFWFNGNSGTCSKLLVYNTNEIRPLGPTCFDHYLEGDAESGFGLKARKSYDGILSDDCARNPDFCTWNRVHIVGCGNDQYQGTSEHAPEAVHTDEDGAIYSAAVWSQGAQIAKDALLYLTTPPADAPDLSDATSVVLAGSSGGSSGLVMTLDSLASYAATLVLDPAASIVGFADARLEPAVDAAEAMFDDGADCASIFAQDCGAEIDVPPGGLEDSGFRFNHSAFLPNVPSPAGRGSIYERDTGWGADLDDSCEAVHGADSPFCHDAMHVAFDHLATPIFFVGSLVDTNQSNNTIGYLAEDQTPTCWAGLAAGSSTLQEVRNRTQAVAYATFRDDPAGGSHGDSHGAGPIGIWAAKHYAHEMIRSDCLFNSLEVGSAVKLTVMEAFTSWLAGNQVILIDGHEGATTANPDSCDATSYASACN